MEISYAQLREKPSWNTVSEISISGISLKQSAMLVLLHDDLGSQYEQNGLYQRQGSVIYTANFL